VTFVRVKRVRGRPYGYLVENTWRAERGQSRQRVLGYLGRLDRFRPERLPAAHRTPEILHQLTVMRAAERKRTLDTAARHRERFVAALLAGDAARTARMAKEGIRDLGREEFLEHVLAGALHEIGHRWSQGAVTVSQEHLASAILIEYLARLNGTRSPRASTGPEVVLCVPDGEQHTLPLLLAEIPLREKGYRIANIGPSAPTESTAAIVRARRPAGVLISVTQPRCLESAGELARELRRQLPNLRVAIGGQAVASSPTPPAFAGVELHRGPIADYLDAWPDVRPRS